MNLAVFSDDLGGSIGEDTAVEMVSIRRQFAIAKTHSHLVPSGALEQRLRRGVWHLALKPAIDLGLILHVPARKECGECQLRIDDQVGAPGFGVIHQRDHALHDGLAAIGFLDGAHLGGGDIDNAHEKLPGASRSERDDFSSNRHPALSFCLSMISAQTLRVCREGKPVPTFPDHALPTLLAKLASLHKYGAVFRTLTSLGGRSGSTRVSN